MDDWKTVNFQKVQLLQHLQQLTPWYAPQAPEATSPLNTGSQQADVQSFDGPVIIPPPALFAASLHGIVLPLELLLSSNATALGDLPTIVQRLKALGFNAVQLPFMHAANISLTHPCTQSNQSTLLEHVVGPPISNAAAVAQGALPNVTYLPVNEICNEYAVGLSWLQTVAASAEVIVQNGMHVLLQDTDLGLAMHNPAQWLTDWASLATNLLNLPQDQLILGVLSDTNLSTTWDSEGSPGFGELIQTAMGVILPILPQSTFAVEGLRGDDFTSSAAFFAQLVSQGYSNRLTAYYDRRLQTEQDDPSLYSNFTSLGTQGVCLTQASCNQLVLVEHITLGQNLTAQAKGGNWFVSLQDPVAITHADVSKLAVEDGLAPWYTPKSAYNPIAGPATPDTGSVQSADTSAKACTVNIRLVAVSDVGADGGTAGLTMNVTNLRPQTVMPPWTFYIDWPQLQQVVKAYGVSSATSGLQVPGSYNGTVINRLLWPNALNNHTILLVINMQNTTLDDFSVRLNNQDCQVAPA